MVCFTLQLVEGEVLFQSGDFGDCCYVVAHVCMCTAAVATAHNASLWLVRLRGRRGSCLCPFVARRMVHHC